MTKTRMRFFLLERSEDVSGTSGTGIVAEGCEFSSGWCAITWLTPLGTYAWYPNIKSIDGVHGHGGKTRVVWLDENGLPEAAQEQLPRRE
jgi:hypothetical protein